MERRAEGRGTSHEPARIVQLSGRQLDATVLDASLRGVRLRTGSDEELSSVIGIHFLATRSYRLARVVWQRQDEDGITLGAAFLSA